MADTYIPKTMIDGYKKFKKTYPELLLHVTGGEPDEEIVKEILGEVKPLFKSFDKGLSALMKSAKTTDKPEKAKVILEKIVKVLQEYQDKTKRIEKWALKVRSKSVDAASGIEISKVDIEAGFLMISTTLRTIQAVADKALDNIG